MTNPHLARAVKLAPIVERVHGAHHPEMTRVREIAEELVRADTARSAELFGELRAVTGSYAVPDDVCEAFEATYNALEHADRELTQAA
ncbi:iron-sulfur cluster repair di-iron protein, ric [Corynebacterium comes]|uniref:Iron-sulfur cluster repair di-iron protein, ric n=1 Tax=Corynebacterium comes TaxID=2675218 RepID=A0A6B8VE08_9CORY|nr:iron-sulfur cluster repair di-iron protein, ric [Corynebacterium comes]QGU03472.1 hypothetical protein CETAM_00895 [Corynebacterium comes]